MKSQSAAVLLSLAALAIIAPAAPAQQYGMDQDYHTQMLEMQRQEQINRQTAQTRGLAYNSTADAKTDGYHTTGSAWQDMDYVSNQYAPKGNIQAPIQRSEWGAISTYQGNKGQFLKGSMHSGQSLPRTYHGSMAIAGGYTNDACGRQGNGGFGAGGRSKVYPGLPPTSLSTCDIHTAK